MTGAPEFVDVGERTRKALIRRRVGPPRPFEEPKVPDDLAALLKRREPLIDRLEKVKNSSNLQLSEYARTAIEEAMEMLLQFGWPRDG